MSLKVHHYGVTVSNLDRSLEFYRDRLGLDVNDRSTYDTEAFNNIVGLEDQTADIAFLDGGTSQIELVEYATEGRNVNDAAGNDVGVAHLNFATDDLRGWYDDLSDDIEFLSEPQTMADGAIVVTMLDPDGNLVELIETP